MAIPQLSPFLDSKPLYYKEIDHKRIHEAYALLKPHIKRPTTIQIVGTNGKGSTGRMIAHLAYTGGLSPNAGQVIHDSSQSDKSQITRPLLSVGHYTSPHILKFNERIWLDGADASDAVLEAAHRRLYPILGRMMSEVLSYFEYTTLLAFVVFEDCDLMVLEAGLGGEFDATSVCEKELSVITPIGIDHQAFLGEDIETIAATKLRSIQPGGKVLLSPQPYEAVYRVAEKMADNVGADLRVCPQVDTRVDPYGLNGVKAWPDFLIQNAAVAMEALDMLHIPYDPKGLQSLELFGRFYPLRDNVRIDVGHNPLAARAIVEAMEPQTVLIYHSLDDKDYAEVLRTLQPKLKRIEIISIDSQRAATREAIEAAVAATGLPWGYFDGVIDPKEHYLVFGSFYVVEKFLIQLEMMA